MSRAVASGKGSALAGADEGMVSAATQLGLQQSLVRYASALDQRDLRELEAVHTEHATWTFRIAKTDIGPVVGRAAILDFVRSSNLANSDRTRHNLVNISVEKIDSQSARVKAYLLLTSNSEGAARLISTGSYSIELRRDRDAWLISNLFLDMDGAPTTA